MDNILKNTLDNEAGGSFVVVKVVGGWKVTYKGLELGMTHRTKVLATEWADAYNLKFHGNDADNIEGQRRLDRLFGFTF